MEPVAVTVADVRSVFLANVQIQATLLSSTDQTSWIDANAAAVKFSSCLRRHISALKGQLDLVP